MTYVNEYISDADIAKYGIKELDRKFVWLELRSQWTRDEERDIYLRVVGEGREEFVDNLDFSFYWQGTLILARLRRTFGGEHCARSVSYDIRKLIPEKSSVKDGDRMLEDLKEALIAYGGAGVLSRARLVKFDFNF